MKVFVGYRREDEAVFTERVGDHLSQHFTVFQDTDARIPAGVRFEAHIRGVLAQCDVFLAVIGPQWLTASEGGRRRLDEPGDWVRTEIELALSSGLRVVPVLVNGARMPRRDELPATIHGLLDWQAAVVRRNPDFRGDMDRLMEDLRGAHTADARTIDCGGTPLELVWVPPGTFWMGATNTPGQRGYDAQAWADEGPVREVEITRGFWLGRHPVTVRQYQAFCAATGHPPTEALKEQRLSAPDLPVTKVDWNDAAAFCGWLTTPDGLHGALPTEAEWEWAARGTDGRRSPWGSQPPDTSRAVWLGTFGAPHEWREWDQLGATEQAAVQKVWAEHGPAPVGGRPAGRGPFGAEDQACGVWEWCRDAWGATHASERVDPCRPGDNAAPRVYRGGSWRSPSRSLRAAIRYGYFPGYRDDDLGFRVLLRPAR